MQTPIQTAVALYAQSEADFAQSFQEHLGAGCVISMPHFFLMGYFSRHDQPRDAVAPEQADCVFVTMHVGDMGDCLAQLARCVKYVAFNREFRGDATVRVYDIKKFNQAIQWVA